MEILLFTEKQPQPRTSPRQCNSSASNISPNTSTCSSRSANDSPLSLSPHPANCNNYPRPAPRTSKLHSLPEDAVPSTEHLSNQKPSTRIRSRSSNHQPHAISPIKESNQTMAFYDDVPEKGNEKRDLLYYDTPWEFKNAGTQQRLEALLSQQKSTRN